MISKKFLLPLVFSVVTAQADDQLRLLSDSLTPHEKTKIVAIMGAGILGSAAIIQYIRKRRAANRPEDNTVPENVRKQSNAYWACFAGVSLPLIGASLWNAVYQTNKTNRQGIIRKLKIKQEIETGLKKGVISVTLFRRIWRDIKHTLRKIGTVYYYDLDKKGNIDLKTHRHAIKGWADNIRTDMKKADRGMYVATICAKLLAVGGIFCFIKALQKSSLPPFHQPPRARYHAPQNNNWVLETEEAR